MISAAIYTGVMRLNVHGSPGWKWLVEVMEPRLCKQNSIKISYKFSLVLCSVLKSRSDLRWETLKQERVNCILKELCILGCITKPVPSGVHCYVFCWQMNMTCSILTLHLLPPISVQDCRDENFSVNMLRACYNYSCPLWTKNLRNTIMAAIFYTLSFGVCHLSHVDTALMSAVKEWT